MNEEALAALSVRVDGGSLRVLDGYFEAATWAHTGPADGVELRIEDVLVVGLLQPSSPPTQGRGAGGGNVGAI